MRKLHYNKSNVYGRKTCNPSVGGGCTTVLKHVTCKKCLRVLVKKGGPKMSKAAYSQYLSEDIKRAGFSFST